MIRRKFLKKVERNPLKEAVVFVVLIVMILVTFVLVVRYFMNNEKPFATSDKKQLGYLSFKMLFDGEESSSYNLGQPIDVSMVVKNVSDKPVELNFPYSSEVDFLVYREENWILFKVPALVWSSSIEAKNYKKPHSIIIPPEGTKVFSARWMQKNQNGSPAKPGSYRIVGKMVTNDFSIALSLKGGSD